MIHDAKHKIPTKSSHHFQYRLGWYFMLIDSRNNRESQETSALQHRALPKARAVKPVTTQCFDWLKHEQWQDSALGRPRTYLTRLQTKSPQYMTILEHTGGQCSFVTQEDAHISYAYSKYVHFSILSNTHTQHYVNTHKTEQAQIEEMHILYMFTPNTFFLVFPGHNKTGSVDKPC